MRTCTATPASSSPPSRRRALRCCCCSPHTASTKCERGAACDTMPTISPASGVASPHRPGWPSTAAAMSSRRSASPEGSPSWRSCQSSRSMDALVRAHLHRGAHRVVQQRLIQPVGRRGAVRQQQQREVPGPQQLGRQRGESGPRPRGPGWSHHAHGLTGHHCQHTPGPGRPAPARSEGRGAGWTRSTAREAGTRRRRRRRGCRLRRRPCCPPVSGDGGEG